MGGESRVSVRDISGVRPAGASRYDLVLVAIPLAFLVALSASVALSVPVRESMTVASLVGALAVVDALFLNPPS